MSKIVSPEFLSQLLRVFMALLGVIFAIIAGYLLFKGYWIDETSTVGVLNGNSLSETVSQTIRNIHSGWGYSIILWMVAQIAPTSSEFAYRLPSLMCGLGAVVVCLLWLKRTQMGVQYPLWVLFLVFFSAKWFFLSSSLARPYSLATLLSFLAFYLYERWSVSSSYQTQLGVALCLFLIPFIHPMYMTSSAVLFAWVVVDSFSGRLKRTNAISLVTIVGLSQMVAGYILYPELHHRMGTVMPRISAPPIIPGLWGDSSFWTLSAVTFLLAVGRSRREPGFLRQLATDGRLVKVIMLWLIPPVSLFIVSRWTLTPVNNARYLIPAMTGMLVCNVYVFGKLGESQRTILLYATLILWTNMIDLGFFMKDFRHRDWRVLLSLVTAERRNGEPVVLVSGHLESCARTYFFGSESSSIAFSPLLVYPVGEPLVRLPIAPFCMDAFPGFENEVIQRLSSTPTFFFIEDDHRYSDWIERIKKKFEIQCSDLVHFPGQTVLKCTRQVDFTKRDRLSKAES